MTLSELGNEYLERYEIILKRIKELKKTEKELSKKGQLKLRGRILSLYEDALSLKYIGEHLAGYYGGNV